jgi:hypothetical protein
MPTSMGWEIFLVPRIPFVNNEMWVEPSSWVYACELSKASGLD